IANAAGLAVPENGLGFPPCGVDDLPHVLRGRENGGVLQHDGMVEVVSCLERDGRPVFRDLRWGVYVVLKAPNEYARTCFKEYGLKTDASGWYGAMSRQARRCAGRMLPRQTAKRCGCGARWSGALRRRWRRRPPRNDG